MFFLFYYYRFSPLAAIRRTQRNEANAVVSTCTTLMKAFSSDRLSRPRDGENMHVWWCVPVSNLQPCPMTLRHSVSCSSLRRRRRLSLVDRFSRVSDCYQSRKPSYDSTCGSILRRYAFVMKSQPTQTGSRELLTSGTVSLRSVILNELYANWRSMAFFKQRCKYLKKYFICRANKLPSHTVKASSEIILEWARWPSGIHVWIYFTHRFEFES